MSFTLAQLNILEATLGLLPSGFAQSVKNAFSGGIMEKNMETPIVY